MPDVLIGDSLNTWIEFTSLLLSSDLCKSLASLLDLPCNNPLWPEAHPYLERYYSSLGAINQIRYGFIHRLYMIMKFLQVVYGIR
jgi:hypothetical protein